MLELLQIKEQLEEKGYENTDSLFELRVLLMEAASFLTKQHISNLKHRKDVKSSARLLKAFNNIRNYYHVIETNKQEHAQCFSKIKYLVLTDISNLLSSHNTQDYKIIPLQNIAAASPGIVK
jgi:hypothetical protein